MSELAKAREAYKRNMPFWCEKHQHMHHPGTKSYIKCANRLGFSKNKKSQRNKAIQPATDVIKKNAKLFYFFWNSTALAWSREALNAEGIDDINKYIKGLEEFARLLLDNAKDVLNKSEVFNLDDFLDGYLSEEDFDKYAKE